MQWRRCLRCRKRKYSWIRPGPGETIQWLSPRGQCRSDRSLPGERYDMSPDNSYEKKIQCLGQVILELAALDDGIEKTMLQQELAFLETFGQLLTDGLFDDAGSGETD